MQKHREAKLELQCHGQREGGKGEKCIGISEGYESSVQKLTDKGVFQSSAFMD